MNSLSTFESIEERNALDVEKLRMASLVVR